MHSVLAKATTFTAHRRVLISHRLFVSSPAGYVELIESYSRDRALNLGRALHAHLIVNGSARLTYFATKLISFYVECKQLSSAHKLFEKIPQTNLRRWIVLTGAYSRHGFHHEAMSLFCKMQGQGLSPNKFVLPSVLKSCGHLSDRRTGEKIHAAILRHELESDAFVSSSLIDMYSKCKEFRKARLVFDKMPVKDLVAANAMVSGYVQLGFVKEAMCLVQEIQKLGLKPNIVTWNTLISGFSQVGDDSMVSEIFQLMRPGGIEPDVVSWTSVISGFVQRFRNEEAFDTFRQMLGLGLLPSSATISSLLPACASIADSRHGKAIHGYSVMIGVEDDIYVRSALVDMYAKCGFIYEAKTLFDTMPERNRVTWNSMIFGFTNHGYCTEAINLFNQMIEEEETTRIKPDHLTFTAVFTACSHAGLVELGENLFCVMQEKYQIEPRIEHYACLVDLLGRAGKIAEAYDLIKTMPIEPDLFVWGALLGACRKHGNIELAEIAAKHLRELEPDSRGSGLLLSSLYADAGSWEEAARVKKMMKKRKSRKFPGCSWVESM